jgi:putative Holliday junction resolvase
MNNPLGHTVRYIGIDYGTKRIGVAVSDETGTFATPIATVPNGGDAQQERLVAELVRLAQQHKATVWIFGESKDYHNKENPIMSAVRNLAESITAATGQQVVFEPEFMTSMAAARLQHDMGGSKEAIDASAAALIVQHYLDRHRAHNN